MNSCDRLVATFEKVATAAAISGGLSAGNAFSRGLVGMRSAWRGASPTVRNAVIGAGVGGVLNKLRGGDFLDGAAAGGLVGGVGTKFGLPDLYAKGANVFNKPKAPTVPPTA